MSLSIAFFAEVATWYINAISWTTGGDMRRHTLDIPPSEGYCRRPMRSTITLERYVWTRRSVYNVCYDVHLRLRTLKKNNKPDRFRDGHETTVNAIINNTYVNDWLESCNPEEEIIELAKIVRFIHNEGGFEMRNWSSNSVRVLEALGASP